MGCTFLLLGRGDFDDDGLGGGGVLVDGAVVLECSGTSVVAKQLFALGWNQCDADEQFAESVSIRKLNRQILLTGKLDVAQAEKVLRNLPSPWAVKDPRFVEFLPHWLPVLSRLAQPPLLLWLRRDVDALRQSYISRDELLPDDRPGIRGRPVEELCELAKRNFERYPWQKLSLTWRTSRTLPSCSTLRVFELTPAKKVFQNLCQNRPARCISNCREIDVATANNSNPVFVFETNRRY